MLITAFVKKNLFGCAKIGYVKPGEELINEPGKGNCMHELEHLIGMVFLVRIVLNIVEVGQPFVSKMLNSRAMRQKNKIFKTKAGDGNTFDVEHELTLQEYENTFEDYTEMVLQFGLMTMFVGAFPLAPIIAFAESTFEIRVDAFKLCSSMRRPIPREAEDIGTWATYLIVLSRVAIVVNIALLLFTAGNLSSWPMKARVVIFFCASVFCLLAFELILLFVPDSPEKRDQVLKRHDFLINRYIKDDRESVYEGSISSKVEGLEDFSLLEKEEGDNYEEKLSGMRVQLLEKLHTMYTPHTFSIPEQEGIELVEDKSESRNISSKSLASSDIETKELSGMEAIREAVRRSTYSFEEGGDTDPWANITAPAVSDQSKEETKEEYYYPQEPIFVQHETSELFYREIDEGSEQSSEEETKGEGDPQDHLFDVI